MIQNIIRFSVKNKLVVAIGVVALIIAGINSMLKLPLDAVPDITNNQVQIVTSTSSLAPQEVEQLITFPVENSMANIPGVTEVRSISRFGLSVVTVVFEEDVPILNARQFVKEQIDVASSEIPSELGSPEMMPITTGLGEIYQYVLQVDPKSSKQYSPMELRTIQDWIVKKQLMGVEGIIEVSSFGGFLKQYEVAVDPLKMQSRNVTMSEVFAALEKNNQNSGGSYIEKGNNAFYIRTEGLVKTLGDIDQIVVKENGVAPVLIRDIAKTGYGSPSRYGAMTMDGKGEAVGGITLMLKGANSSQAIDNVHERIERIQSTLPEGVSIYPYLDRSVLVGKAIHTVSKNLIEGGLIVIFVLVLLLGNFRAGLVVASVIPLSLLFAFILMNYFGVSANLMSLGAIDFGIVIDGAVIIVEGVLHLIYTDYKGRKLSRSEMDDVIVSTSSKIIGSAAFGVLIIIVVFVPIMTLTGIEGKMFSPMAQTVSFAIIGALILSVTYVPMMSALTLNRNIKEKVTFADRIMGAIENGYKPILQRVLNVPKIVIFSAIGVLVGAVLLFRTLGAEFIPTLDEGDLAMQCTIDPGSSLTRMVETTSKAEAILKAKFPEVKHVVSKIGTAEVPTDPMAVEDADVMILLKDKSEWTSASTREELVGLMKQSLEEISWAQFDFTQPIELRFNELISGSKSDLAIKVFGEELDELSRSGEKIVSLIKDIPGAGDVKLEQTEGLPQLMIRYNREKLAMYQLNIEDINKVIRAAYAGEPTGVVYEGQKRFDLTVRLDEKYRKDVNLAKLFVNSPTGQVIPISEVASIRLEEGPMQVSRENAQRRISVGVNVRNRDLAGFVGDVQKRLESKLDLKPGYYVEYGGQFENLEAAKKRLGIAVPIALAMIFFLLYLAFRSVKYALLIYITVPLSAVGGIAALFIRDMPFSISAGVGFIALFGVAVLNGIVLITYFNRLKNEGEMDLKEVVFKGSLVRLRPVLMTAMVASLGFLPMALATSAGAEVQKPLATVVIGGLISATILTLLVLPVLYMISHKKMKMNNKVIAVLFVLISISGFSQSSLTLDAAVDSAMLNNIEILRLNRSKEVAKLEGKGAYSLGNTNVNLQYGQMNTIDQDRYFEVDQEIGNLLEMKRKKDLASAKEMALEGENKLLSRKIKVQTQISWLDWMHAIQSKKMVEEQHEMWKKHLDILRSKDSVGDVSKMEVSLAELQSGILLKSINEWDVAIRSAEKNLIQLTGIKGDLEPDSTFIFSVESGNVLLSELKTDELLSGDLGRLSQYEMQKKMNNSGYFPQFSLGYFNQSIEHVAGYQGLKLGISVPILDRSNRIDAKKSQIQIDQQQDEINYLENNLEKGYDLTKLNYQDRLTLVDQYNNHFSNFVSQLDESAQLAYDSGDIDYYNYLISKTKVLEVQLMGLEVKKEALIAKYELEYYTK